MAGRRARGAGRLFFHPSIHPSIPRGTDTLLANDTNRPVPAAIDGRRWVVSGSGGLTGGTNTRRAELFAPLVDTPTARFIRNHELMHARITPHLDPGAVAKKNGCTFEALQWAEDWRVERALDRRGLIPPDAISEAEADLIAGNVGMDPRLAAGAILSNWDCNGRHGFAGGPRDRIQDAMVRAGWNPESLGRIIDRVETIIDGAMSTAFARRRRGRAPAVHPIETSKGFSKITIPLARMFDAEFPPGGTESEGKGRPNPEVDRIPGLAKWAPIADIRRLPMPNQVRPRRPIGRRFSDAGVIPSAVHRLPVDGAIFGTRRRAKGGTILCDASGSMNYDDDDVARILRDAPAATVAFYAGAKNGRHGFGRIIIGASNGRAASVGEVMRALPGGHNLIDGPALRWLARQPAPRFWVSDEGVGGMGDFGRGGLCHAECLAICRAAGIRIVPHIDALK